MLIYIYDIYIYIYIYIYVYIYIYIYIYICSAHFRNRDDSGIAPARFRNSSTVAQSWNSKIAQSDSRIVHARFKKDHIGSLKKYSITV